MDVNSTTTTGFYELFFWDSHNRSDNRDELSSFLDDPQAICSKLDIFSSKSVQWAIELNVMKKRLTQTHKIFNQSFGDKPSSYVFVKLHDINRTVVFPKVAQVNSSRGQDFSSSPIPVPFESDITIEEKLVHDEDLVLEQSWKAHGSRYLLDDIIVSVGLLENHGIPVKCVLEICKEIDRRTNEASLLKLERYLAQNLIPQGIVPTSFSCRGDDQIGRGELWSKCCK